MSNITIAFVFVMMINVLMAGAQFEMQALNDVIEVTMMSDCTSTAIGSYVGCSNTSTISATDIKNDLPGATAQPSPTNAVTFFFDTFTSIVGFVTSGQFLKIIETVVLAPYWTFALIFGSASVWAILLAGAWYIISVLLIAAFMWGRFA